MLINDQTIIYILILLLVSLALLLVALIVLYVRLLGKYVSLKEGKTDEIDPAKYLAQAQSRAQKILEEAHLKARETIANADKFVKIQEGEMGVSLEKANSKITSLYADALSQITKEGTKVLQTLPEDLKLLMVSAIDNARESIQKEVAAIQAKVAQNMSESLKAAEAEIENYKKQRKDQIDKGAVKLVGEVTKKVLGRQISLDEHEKLVLKALEEAKRQDIL